MRMKLQGNSIRSAGAASPRKLYVSCRGGDDIRFARLHFSAHFPILEQARPI
jgi:hypothetical protein